MDYINGTTAFELSATHGNSMSIPPAYADHYFAQLADIMVQLASLRFPSIGSITEGSSANYTTSLITETYTGSYPNPHAFYHNSLLDLALRRCLNRPHTPRPGQCCTSSPWCLGAHSGDSGRRVEDLET